MKYYFLLAGIALFFIVFIIIIIVLLNHKKTKRKNDIMNLFQRASKLRKIENYHMEYVKKETYDFYYENDKHIYYIKVIQNPANNEICINNAIKWQVRKLGEREHQMQFVNGIEPLMRLDLHNKKKKEHKLFIIYPNTRALLKVINECEMVFVYPDTDVYGATVITYRQLESDPSLLNL